MANRRTLAKITLALAQVRPYIPFMFFPPTLTLSERFTEIIGGLCRALSAQGAWARAAGPLGVLIWGRLCRMRNRFTALAARVRAGELPAKAPARRPPASPRPATPRPSASPDLPRLPPQRSGWLVRLVPEPHHLNAWRVPLDELLADPEMVALAAAAPQQAGRIVRPMCRMLGVKPPPYLQLPRPRRPRPKVAKKPLTPEQVDAKVARMSRLAYANMINPNDPDPLGIRPPNRIGYGRPRPFPKPDRAG
jgi:hypothetical protein